MAGEERRVQWVLGVTDNVSKRVGGIRGALKGVGAAVGAAATALGVAVAAADKFNQSMGNVATLIPGQTARLAELSDGVQELARRYGTDTGGLSDGLYQAISAFGDTSDTLAILEVNQRAAKAGVAATSEAIALSSAVTKAWGDTSEVAVQKSLDLGLSVVRLGQTDFPALAAALPRVTAGSVALGVSQEELSAVFATTTGVVGNAAEVSTGLRAAYTALQSPTTEMASLLDILGVSSGKALIEQVGLQGGLELVSMAADASGTPLAKYLGSVDAVNLAQSLAGEQAEQYADNLAEMSAAAGATDAAFEAMTTGVNANREAFNRLKQHAVTAMQDLGTAVVGTEGAIGVAALAVAEFGGNFIALIPQIGLTITAMGGLPVVMGGVATAAKFMWAAISGPIGRIVSALAVVAAGVTYLWKAWKKGADEGKAAAEDAAGAVDTVVDATVEGNAEILRAQEEANRKREEMQAQLAERLASAAAADAEKEAAAVAARAKKAADEAAAEAEKAAEAERRAFWDTVDRVNKQRVESSAQAMRRVMMQAQVPVGANVGLNFADAFNGGFIEGVENGVGAGSAALSKVVGGGAGTAGQSFTDAFGEQVSLWSNGGGWSGLFTGLTGAIQSFANGGLKGGLTTIANTALSFLPAPFAQAGQAALSAFTSVWSKIKRPSEEELAARESFNGIHAAAVQTFGATAEHQAGVQRLVAQGWSTTLAETKVSFELAAEAAGQHWTKGSELYAAYQQAVHDGNTALVSDIEATYNEWSGHAIASAEEREAAAAKAAAEEQAMLNATYNAALSAYDKANAAATAAYDATLEKAIEAGLGEEAAVRKAAAASVAERERVLEAAKNTFQRQYVLETTLAAIREGNAVSAAEVARKAARDSETAWTVALGAIEQADAATADALQGGAQTTADAIGAALTNEDTGVLPAVSRSMVEQTTAAQGWAAAIGDSAVASGAAVDSALTNEDTGALRRVRKELQKIVNTDWRVDIDYRGNLTGDHPAGGGGGGELPVGATGGIVRRPTIALIGEAGPEAVVPLNRTAGNSPLPPGGLGGAQHITVESRVTLDRRELGYAIAEVLPEMLRKQGVRV